MADIYRPLINIVNCFLYYFLNLSTGYVHKEKVNKLPCIIRSQQLVAKSQSCVYYAEIILSSLLHFLLISFRSKRVDAAKQKNRPGLQLRIINNTSHFQFIGTRSYDVIFYLQYNMWLCSLLKYPRSVTPCRPVLSQHIK